MAHEIERRYLVRHDRFVTPNNGEAYSQSYISGEIGPTVRIRIIGTRAYLTLKSERKGIARLEYEYSIPVNEALEMQSYLSSTSIVTKTRYRVLYHNYYWDIDVYNGRNQGLCVAEIEIPSETTTYDIPDWVSIDISNRPEFWNGNLARRPFDSLTVSVRLWAALMQRNASLINQSLTECSSSKQPELGAILAELLDLELWEVDEYLIIEAMKNFKSDAAVVKSLGARLLKEPRWLDTWVCQPGEFITYSSNRAVIKLLKEFGSPDALSWLELGCQSSLPDIRSACLDTLGCTNDNC